VAVTDLMKKNHTDNAYGKKTVRARAAGVFGKLTMRKLKTRQVY
jgi:hypothetical protein